MLGKFDLKYLESLEETLKNISLSKKRLLPHINLTTNNKPSISMRLWHVGGFISFIRLLKKLRDFDVSHAKFAKQIIINVFTLIPIHSDGFYIGVSILLSH